MLVTPSPQASEQERWQGDQYMYRAWLGGIASVVAGMELGGLEEVVGRGLWCREQSGQVKSVRVMQRDCFLFA